MKIELMKVEDLIPYENNAKLHPKEQIDQIINSIKQFGFNERWVFYPKNFNYIVSEKGKVACICRKQKSKSGNNIVKYRFNLLKGSIDKYGYRTIRMRIDGIKRHIKAHRIIANCFLENPEDKKQVNHKDMDKMNNNISNLEWVSDIENKKHYNLAVGNNWNG